MSNSVLQKGFANSVLKDVSAPKNELFNRQNPLAKEDIWGADFGRYRQEVFQLGLALFAFSSLLMIFAYPLSIFGDQVALVQGLAFAVFLAGASAIAKVFWEQER